MSQPEAEITNPELAFNREYIEHLICASETLSICTIEDIEKSLVYQADSRILEELGETALGSAAVDGEFYAWKRLPRWMDRLRETRNEFETKHTGETFITIDFASSFPIYAELLRTVWLRRCGNRGDELATGLKSQPYGEKETVERVASNAFAHHRFASDLLASHIQIALATVPVELSGDVAAIEDYIQQAILYLSVHSTQFIYRSEHRHHVEIKGVPALERAWRIDGVMMQTPASETLVNMLEGSSARVLNENAKEGVRLLYDLANTHKKNRDDKLAAAVVAKAEDLASAYGNELVVDRQTALGFLVFASRTIAKDAMAKHYGHPWQSYSVDMAPVEDIIAQSSSSFDPETRFSGLYRRTLGRLARGDDLHITADITKGDLGIPDSSVAHITSFEGWPYFTDVPRDAVPFSHAANSTTYVTPIGGLTFDLDASNGSQGFQDKIEEVANTLRTLYNKLCIGGKIIIFPWDIANMDTHAKAIFLEAVQNKLASLPDEQSNHVERHPLKTVLGWMSAGEHAHYGYLSPIFRRYLEAGVDEVMLPALVIKRQVKPKRSLQGPKQLRSPEASQ